MRPRSRSCRTFVGMLAFVLSALTGDAQPSPRHFDLPEGTASRQLKEFARQAQCEIVFSPELTAQVVTHAVHDELSPTEALTRMLEGTGLVFTRDASGAFAVRRAPRVKPAPSGRPSAHAGATDGSELVTLSPFVVPAETVGRYTAAEATSGSRVRVSLMNSPQGVSVVTRSLLDDIGATRILDAAKYVAGVSESTIPNAQDRTNIRGFQTDGATIDGFNFFSFANVDPVLVDRIEVVKGPNAILSPQIVQGTINLISRKPTFTNRGSVAAAAGRYNANRAELDVDRVLVPGRLAGRVVAAVQHSHDLAGGNFNHSLVAMPMLTFAFSESAAITLQAQVYNNYSAAYGGLPIDLHVGTNDPAHLLSGLPIATDLYGATAARHSVGAHYRLLFTAQPTEHLSVRLAANAAHWHGSSVSASLGAALDAAGQPIATIALDPATGAWRATGALNPDPVFPRGGTVGYQSRTYYNLQNDYAYQRELGGFDTTTLVGVMSNSLRNPAYGLNIAVPPLEIRRARGLPGYTLLGLNGSAITYASDQQVYANEVLAPKGGYLVGTAGVARAWYKSYVADLLANRTASTTPSAVLASAGLVIKPWPSLSLFAGISRQSTAVAASTAGAIPNRLQTGKQGEAGMRTELMDRRVFASIAYFSISQSNFAVPNPGNSAVPPPTPPLPPMYTNLRVTGLELELRAALTNNLSIIGSASTLRARNPMGQPLRGVADRTAVAWIDYALGRTSGGRRFSLGVGVDYLGKRAGDFPSSTPTSASTPSHLIMPQPSFWLPARTLLNLGATYRFGGHWQLQLNIDNVLDRHYLAASTSRNTVFPGTPINPRLALKLEF